MVCWKAKQCPEDVRETCPAYRTGNTSELKCRRLAPLERMFEGTEFDCNGRMVGNPVIRCFSCPVYHSQRETAKRCRAE
jgi:hypothetical protein